MAQITMTLDEWNQHLAEKARIAEECSTLKAELDRVRQTAMLDAGADIIRLEQLVRSAMTLVTFATGNLPPEMTPNWPHSALVNVINALSALPTYSAHDEELRIELTAMADDIARHNRRRARALQEGVDPTPVVGGVVADTVQVASS